MLRNFVPIRRFSGKRNGGRYLVNTGKREEYKFDLNDDLKIPVREISSLYGTSSVFMSILFKEEHYLRVYKLGPKYYEHPIYVRSGAFSFPIGGGERQDEIFVQRIDFSNREDMKEAYRMIVNHEDFRGYHNCV